MILAAWLSTARADEVGIGVAAAFWQGSARLELSPGLSLRAAFEPSRWVGLTAEASAAVSAFPDADARMTVVHGRASVVAELLVARQAATVRLGLGPAVGFGWSGAARGDDNWPATVGSFGMRYRAAIDVPIGAVHLVPYSAVTVHTRGTDVDIGLGLGWSL